MKELDQHFNKGDKTEIVASKKQESQYVLIGNIKPKRGQRVFEVNVTTESIIEAQYKESAIDYSKAISGDMSKKRELVINEGCIYIPALNEANALKKFRQSKNQADYYSKEPVMTFDEMLKTISF